MADLSDVWLFVFLFNGSIHASAQAMPLQDCVQMLRDTPTPSAVCVNARHPSRRAYLTSGVLCLAPGPRPCRTRSKP